MNEIYFKKNIKCQNIDEQKIELVIKPSKCFNTHQNSRFLRFSDNFYPKLWNTLNTSIYIGKFVKIEKKGGIIF